MTWTVSKGDQVTVKHRPGVWTVDWVGKRTADLVKTFDGNTVHLNAVSFDRLRPVQPEPEPEPEPDEQLCFYGCGRPVDVCSHDPCTARNAARVQGVWPQQKRPDTTPDQESPVAEALRIFTGDRENDYGENTAPAIAQTWSAYLGVDIDGRDVCWMMLQLKAIRDKYSAKRDNQVDAHGYLLLMERNPRAL